MLFVVAYITFALQLCAIPLAGGVALFKGDRPERYGAIIMLVPILLEEAALPVAKHLGYHLSSVTPYIELFSTLVVSSGFLYLAVRYASLWLAAAMVISGTELYFVRAFIDSDPPNYNLYITEVNTVTAAVLLTLGGAAVSSWRARIRKSRDEQTRVQKMTDRDLARDLKFREMFESRARPAAQPALSHPGVARLIIEPPPL